MSRDKARTYFERSDDSDASIGDVVELFADDAVLKSPREGTFRGHDEIREFYELNAEFFAEGVHNITEYHRDKNVIVCEGTIEGRTSAGRQYEGIGLVDIMEFNNKDEIIALRVYLDYSAILTEMPETVPDFRE